MIGCAEATRQLWAYLDAHLGAADRAAVEEHLGRCRRCCGEMEFAQELRGFLVRSTRDEIPGDVLHRLSETLEELGP